MKRTISAAFNYGFQRASERTQGKRTVGACACMHLLAQIHVQFITALIVRILKASFSAIRFGHHLELVKNMRRIRERNQ